MFKKILNFFKNRKRLSSIVLEGWKARDNNLPITENPYAVGTDEASRWDWGWMSRNSRRETK